MLSCEGSVRAARRFVCVGLAALLASSALADDFGEKMKGGQPPAVLEPLVPTDCDQSPCPPTEEQQKSAETNNGTDQCSTGVQCATGGDPVDAYTGRMFLEKTDLVVNGVVPIRMVRQYDSQSRYDSPLGFGWSFTYDTRLFEYSNGEVVVRGWEGRRWRYVPPTLPATQFIPDNPNGGRLPVLEFDPVAGDPVEYVLTYYSGDRALFDSEGRLHAMETAQGNRLRFFYSAQKMPLSGMSPYALNPTLALTVAHVWQLTDIKEQLRSQVGSNPEEFTGRFVHLAYHATTGRLEMITSHDGRMVSYDRTEDLATPSDRGNLAGVFGAHTASETGIQETYLYPATPAAGSTPAAFENIHNVTTYTDGLFTTPRSMTYDAKDRVATQIYGSAQWMFTYVETPTLETTVTRTIVTPGPPPSSQTAITVYDFNFDGFVTQKTDALGNVIQYSRASGHETEEVKVFEASSPPPNPPSRTVAFSYYADGRRETRQVLLAGGETVTETWEYEGPFTSLYKTQSSLPATNVFKTDLDFFLDAQGSPQNVQAIHRRKGDNGSGGDVFVTTTFTYDPAHGQLATITPPAVSPADHLKIRRFYYTAADDLPGATPPLIRNGLLKAVEIISDDGTPPVTVDPHLARGFDYDAAGNVASITDAKGHMTQLAWDGRGRLVRETRQIGATSATWESTLFRYGAPNSGAPGNDGATPGEYLLQIETGALGSTGTSTSGRIHRLVRDARGNVTSVQRKDEFGAYALRSSHAYDTDENRTQSSEPTATGTRTLSFTYDKMKQLRTITDSASPPNVTTFAYDAVGNRTQVEDSKDRDTDFVYDDLDRLVAVIQQGNGDPPNLPAPLQTVFHYDAAGNVTKVIDPKGQETDYAYDALSRLRTVEQHLNQIVVYDYDDRGRLGSVTNARDNVLAYTYAAWGGLEQVEHFLDASASTPLRNVAYTYDLEGNVTSTSDDDVQPEPLFTADPTTGYDARNRLHELTVHYVPGGDLTLTSSYNRFGEREGLDLVQGAETLSHTWSFDARGRLDLATLPGSAPIDFTFLEDDRLAQVVYASGTTTDYSYLPQGPLDTITVTAPGSLQRSRLDYAVDALQSVTNLSEQHASSDPTQAYVYGYDAANRLASADYPAAYGLPADETFGYDAAGNRDDAPGVATPWAYDANNRLTASPGFASYGFDDDGNLTARTGETFSYDFTNRLHSFTKAGIAASYAYDPFGRRIKKEIVDGDTTWYLWDGDQLLAEYDDSGARTVRYAYAGGFAPTQVAYKDGTGEDVYDVHTDHLDTPRLLTDDAGAVVWREAHEAFGKAELDPANTVIFNIRFPGQYFDEESGLHYNRFRTYDSAVGRYVTADPIGQFGVLARYRARVQEAIAAGITVTLSDFDVILNPSGHGPRGGRETLPVNVYTYVDSQPLGGVDVLGLQSATDADDHFINKACGQLCQDKHGAGTPQCDHCMTRCPILTSIPGVHIVGAAVPQTRAVSIWSAIVDYFTSE